MLEYEYTIERLLQEETETNSKQSYIGMAASIKGSTWKYFDQISFLRKISKFKEIWLSKNGNLNMLLLCRSSNDVSGIGYLVSEQNNQETVTKETLADVDETEQKKKIVIQKYI